MLRTIGRGIVAGAAATTALNAVTYADMAIRARPASETPQQAVEALAGKAGQPIPGHGDERQNRLNGLGPLTGLATGVGIGVAAALAGPLTRRLPILLGGVAVGAAAMAASDVPLVKLGLTDPKSWSSADWASDALPHFAYGLMTCLTLRALHRK